MVRKYLVALFTVVAVGFVMYPTKAEAITAWARKYKVDCSMCHAGPMYKLTPIGAEFLRRGHRMADDEPTINWGEIFSINSKMRVHDSNAAGRNATFEFHAFSVYAGGMLSKHVGFFTEIYLYENTGKITGAVNGDFGRSKLADSYLIMNSHPDRDSYTTLRVGQLSPTQTLLYWDVGPRYGETRPYIVNNSTVSPNSYRPFMRNFGIEVGQRVKNFNAAVGLLNGTGSSSTNSIDNNESKDVYMTADVVVDDAGSAIGFYGYRGKGLITPSSGSPWENAFHRVGAFGYFTRGAASLTGAVTFGKEQINALGTKTDNLGVLVQAAYEVTSKVALFSRYDFFDPNRDLADDHLNGPVVGATWRFFEPGRVTFEFHKQGLKPASGLRRPWEYRFELAYMF